MKTIASLTEDARKAIESGDIAEAQRLIAEAKALKELQVFASDSTSSELEELRAFKARVDAEPARNKAGVLTVTEDETDKKAKKPFRTLGEQLKAISGAYLHPQAMDERLAAQKAVLGLNEGQSSDGGFLVQTDFSTEIFQHAHETMVLSNRARRIPISANANGMKMNAIDESSRATGSRWGGIRGYWMAEAGTKTASDLRFRQIEMNLKKMAAVMYATDELLADTVALGSVMTQAGSEELAFLLDDAVMNGLGAGQPLGILASPALVTISQEAGQGAGTIVYENILKMWGRFYARSRPNSVWFMNQDVEPVMNMMDFPVGTGGIPVYLPPGGLSQAPYATLLGRPIIITEFNASVGTVGDIVLADMSQYLIIDKGGIEAASSIHVQFLTDQTAFRWVYRVDGQPMWNSPLTPYKGTNTLSPFVALETRS